MAKVEIKAPIIEEIKEALKDQKGTVLADYRGLTVEQDTNLRRQLREGNVFYKVYKNTYIKKAIEGTELESLVKHLEGPTAIAISKEDSTAPARILANFAKDAPNLELKAGIVEGTYYDDKGIQVIATIPSRDVLIGRLLGSLKNPISNMVRVLDQIAKKEA